MTKKYNFENDCYRTVSFSNFKRKYKWKFHNGCMQVYLPVVFRSFVHSILIIGSSCLIFILLACIIANVRYRDEIDYSRRSSEDITRSSKRFLPHQRVKFSRTSTWLPLSVEFLLVPGRARQSVEPCPDLFWLKF